MDQIDVADAMAGGIVAEVLLAVVVNLALSLVYLSVCMELERENRVSLVNMEYSSTGYTVPPFPIPLILVINQSMHISISSMPGFINPAILCIVSDQSLLPLS